MSDESRGGTGSVLAAFLVGAAVGAVVALLLAPKPGRELREDLARRIREASGTEEA